MVLRCRFQFSIMICGGYLDVATLKAIAKLCGISELFVALDHFGYLVSLRIFLHFY